jgi:hypothetical protein
LLPTRSGPLTIFNSDKFRQQSIPIVRSGQGRGETSKRRRGKSEKQSLLAGNEGSRRSCGD